MWSLDCGFMFLGSLDLLPTSYALPKWMNYSCYIALSMTTSCLPACKEIFQHHVIGLTSVCLHPCSNFHYALLKRCQKPFAS